jgi:hypothetical protein
VKQQTGSLINGTTVSCQQNDDTFFLNRVNIL